MRVDGMISGNIYVRLLVLWTVEALASSSCVWQSINRQLPRTAWTAELDGCAHARARGYAARFSASVPADAA